MERSKVDIDIEMVLSPDYGQSCLSYRVTFHIATLDLAKPIVFYSLSFFCHIWQLWEISSMNISQTRNCILLYLFQS